MPDNSEADPGEAGSTRLVVAIGASAGGLKEIVQIVESLPHWFQGTLVIANHRSPERQNILREILSVRARVDVYQPEDGECLECTTIYVGDSRDIVQVDGAEFDISLDTSAFARMRRIDDLFCSVAESAKQHAVGVILSGMLYDGVEGLKAIHDAGGKCLVQDPEDAAYDSMPRHALAAVPVDFVGTTEEIISRIMEMGVSGDECN